MYLISAAYRSHCLEMSCSFLLQSRDKTGKYDVAGLFNVTPI